MNKQNSRPAGRSRHTFTHKSALIFIFAATFIIGAFLFKTYKNTSMLPKIATATRQNQKTIYPAQYSDKHITENAIVSDPRFKNLVVLKKENLLSNVISATQQNTGAPRSEMKERGSWLLTPILDITPKYRDLVISGAKKNNIRTIYISIDSYLDIFVMPNSDEKKKKKKIFDDILLDFIAEARKNNITVDAEGGWRNWAEAGHSYKAFAVLNYAIEFNKTHTEKLRGFQYDVEPYLMSSYKIDKQSVLGNFLNLIKESVLEMNKSDLELSVVIPDFYDNASGETPVFDYGGKSGYVFDHLLSILERRAGSKIIIMSYRNFSSGDDGSIDVSSDEIISANKYKTKIIVAQETGDVQPQYITFHNTSHAYYNKQLESIQKAFAKDKSFGGVATHYINSLMELK